MEQFDVAVIGGGPAGVIAAIQAGREGARTLLVEKQAQLGGTTTTGGVNNIACFFGYGKQVISGIGWEMVVKTSLAAGKPIPTGTPFSPANGRSNTFVDIPVYLAVLDQAVCDAGVDLRLHTMPGAIEPAGKPGWRLTLCGKEGLYPVQASVVIDATADANVISLAGGPVIPLEERQPGTLVFRLAGYDAETLEYESIQKAADVEIAAGRLMSSDWGWRRGSVKPVLQNHGGNSIHVAVPNAQSSVGRTAMEVEARRVMMRVVTFLRTQPGLEKCHIVSCASECGVRETVVISGRETITGEDYISGRLWPDAVCYSFYPIDMHLEHGLDFRPLPEGVVPTIPYGAMIPLDTTNLLAAGRHISGDRVGSSAYRVQASCMAMGQAAGAAAALAAQKGIPVAEVSVDDIRSVLRRHNAIVPGSSPPTPDLAESASRTAGTPT